MKQQTVSEKKEIKVWIVLGALLMMIFTLGCSFSDDNSGPVPSIKKLVDGTRVVAHDGNPTCADLGYDLELKLDPVPDNADMDTDSELVGEYVPYTFKRTIEGIDFYFTVEILSDGYYISWKSDFDVAAVLVKGGPHAFEYIFPDGATSGTMMYSPDNDGGNLPNISHVDWCINFNLDISKTAIGTIDVTYEWDIDKNVVGDTEITLSSGQSYTIDYLIDVTKTPTDTDIGVSGDVVVTNPWPFETAIEDVTDNLGGMEDIDLKCMMSEMEVTFPPGIDLGLNDELVCSYEVELPDASPRTNTAIVTTAEGETVSGAETKVDVVFGDPVDHNDCVRVEDKINNDSTKVLDDMVCETASLPDSHSIVAGACNTTMLVTNVATVIPLDTDFAPKRDEVMVIIRVPECGVGCTLTQGYWKTHSFEGPAPYDDAWKLLSDDEEDTMFFDSGMTWYEVFWTPPKKGNAYLILAHQYMATVLNGLNGASTPEVVADALKAAAAAFDGADIMDPPCKKDKGALIDLAETLAAYNEGDIGPGHCDSNKVFQ